MNNVSERNPECIAKDGWRHSDKWKREGKNFLVEVSRHSSPEFNSDYSEVIGQEHRWCVYLYVYPRHPDFARFDSNGDMHSQPYYECHIYVSLFRVHRDESGEITSFQLGWDYNHDGDVYYTHLAPPSAAGSVFYDANRLFDEAAERAKVTA